METKKEKISEKEIEKISKLARIGISKEEKEFLKKDLSDILDYFKILDELKTKKTNEPFYPFEKKNSFRQDKAILFPEEDRKTIISQFPEEEGGKLKVKGIL